MVARAMNSQKFFPFGRKMRPSGGGYRRRRMSILSPRRAVLRRHATKIPHLPPPPEKDSSDGIFFNSVMISESFRAYPPESCAQNKQNLAPKHLEYLRQNFFVLAHNFFRNGAKENPFAREFLRHNTPKRFNNTCERFLC